MLPESIALISSSKDPLLLQSNVSVREVHTSQISVGDTILCPDGTVRTVCNRNIHRCPSMGRSIFGDTYQLGHKPVLRVVITRTIYREGKQCFVEV